MSFEFALCRLKISQSKELDWMEWVNESESLNESQIDSIRFFYHKKKESPQQGFKGFIFNSENSK